MRKAITLKGIFDPITESEAVVIRQYVKRGYEVSIGACGPGVLAIDQRQRLLALALRSYRHIHVVSVEDGLDLTDQWQEERVRNGFYRRAAVGIRKVLAEEGMYFVCTVQAHCSDHRLTHSLSVASLCVELAQAQDVDRHLAWTAGILHDVLKSMPDEQAQIILQYHEPDKLSAHPKIWHAYTACYWLKRYMGVTNPKILSAIHAHSTGESKAKLAMILYVADKCERTRGYNSEAEIALAKKDLGKAFRLVYQEAEAYRRRKKNG